MRKRILLLGGGGHCASCIEAIESSGEWEIIGIIDTADRLGIKLLGYDVLGTDDDLPSFVRRCDNALVTVGQIKTASVRMRLFASARLAGYCFPQVVARTAVVSRNGTLGFGTIAMHRCVVNAGVRVGVNCIINTGAIVEHDTFVGDNTHISTGAIVNGGCRIGSECLIGSGSVLRNGITLGDGVVIGAGTVVVNDIMESGVYVGSPARKLG